MILLKIHLAIGVLYLILSTLAVLDVAHDFKLKYPDMKAPKSSLAGKILSLIKNIAVALIPLYNILLCLVFIFNYEQLKEKTMAKFYLKCSKVKNSEEIKNDSSRG